MSLAVLCICPIEGCRYNHNPIYADISQIKRHIRNAHDYKEKLYVAFDLGLINSIFDRRSPEWLVESLSEFSRVRGVD